jgi:hypothetical protein
MDALPAILERHRAALFALPGCTAVAIGKKIAAGKRTNTDSIVVFVKKKGHVPAGGAAPALLEGIPTDVVEKTFDFRPTNIDPFQRFNPLVGGISLTSWEDSSVYGSVGCFIIADGQVPQVPYGNYLLTNQHVLAVAAASDDHRVIQPGNVDFPPPANSAFGCYVFGQRDASHDCAIATIVQTHGCPVPGQYIRNAVNQVPDHPGQQGWRILAGTAAPALNDRVYKYGATTHHTVGNVTNINFSTQDNSIVNAIYIDGENGGVWCDGGDSGSVVIRYADDYVVGLNFRADTNMPVQGGYSAGLAYDILTQMQVFGNVVQLA